MTVPLASIRSVITAEKVGHNQKYSVLGWGKRRRGSGSSRKSLPSPSRRKEAEQIGLAHLLTITQVQLRSRVDCTNLILLHTSYAVR